MPTQPPNRLSVVVFSIIVSLIVSSCFSRDADVATTQKKARDFVTSIGVPTADVLNEGNDGNAYGTQSLLYFLIPNDLDAFDHRISKTHQFDQSKVFYRSKLSGLVTPRLVINRVSGSKLGDIVPFNRAYSWTGVDSDGQRFTIHYFDLSGLNVLLDGSPYTGTIALTKYNNYRE